MSTSFPSLPWLFAIITVSNTYNSFWHWNNVYRWELGKLFSSWKLLGKSFRSQLFSWVRRIFELKTFLFSTNPSVNNEQSPNGAKFRLSFCLIPSKLYQAPPGGGEVYFISNTPDRAFLQNQITGNTGIKNFYMPDDPSKVFIGIRWGLAHVNNNRHVMRFSHH